jgi:hypothetical protein
MVAGHLESYELALATSIKEYESWCKRSQRKALTSHVLPKFQDEAQVFMRSLSKVPPVSAATTPFPHYFTLAHDHKVQLMTDSQQRLIHELDLSLRRTPPIDHMLPAYRVLIAAHQEHLENTYRNLVELAWYRGMQQLLDASPSTEDDLARLPMLFQPASCRPWWRNLKATDLP